MTTMPHILTPNELRRVKNNRARVEEKAAAVMTQAQVEVQKLAAKGYHDEATYLTILGELYNWPPGAYEVDVDKGFVYPRPKPEQN